MTGDKGRGKSLSQGEDRFRLVFDGAADALFLHDLEGRFVEVNQAACDSLGYTREELLQLPLITFAKCANPGARGEIWAKVVQGEKVTIQGVHQRRDGTTFPVEVHLGPFEYAGRPHILASARDISDRIRAEEALRTSESFLNSIIDQSPYPMWISDAQGTLIRLNQALQDLLHITAADVVGKYNVFKDNIVEQQGLIPLLQRVFEKGEKVRFEITYDTSLLRNLPLGTARTVILDVTVSPIIDAQGGITNAVIQHVDITERKRAEAALAESEQRFSTFMAHLPAAIFIKGQDGRLVFANRYLRELFGWQDCLGKNTEELLPPDLAGPMTAADRQVLSAGPMMIREKITDIHGVEHFFDTYKFPVTTEGAPVLLGGIAVDVTERERAVEALRQSEARFRQVVEFSPLPIGIGTEDGTIEYVNPKFVETFGYTLEDIPRITDWFRLAYPEPAYRQELISRWQGSFEKISQGHGATEIAEVQITCKDGSQRIMEVFATTMGNKSLVIFRDLSECKQAEEALRESETRFRQAVEHSPMAIAIVNGEQGEYLNPKFIETLGYTLEDVPSLTAWFQRAYPDPAYRQSIIEQWQQAMHEAMAGDRTIRSLEVEVVCKDGAVRTMDICGILVGSKTLFFCNDLTERKRAAAEKARLEARMREVQKLESLGVLAGGIAHDFNNLLMAILGNADLALLALSPASPARPNIEEIVRASQRAADLCRQMLAYSGKGRFVVGRYDLSEIVREMAQMLKVTVSKKATLRYSFAADLPAVEVDATQMRQVIMNLITNASEALGDESGGISISTGVMHCDLAFFSESHLDDHLPEGDYVYLEVMDTGCGLDEETQRRIFDPFFTTKFTGRGLGLAAVLGIVRGHQGAIKVASKPGRGTSFTIFLPTVAWQPGDRRQTTTQTATPRQKGTILLIDDDPHVRRVAGEMLGRLGLQVLTAARGREGLKIFRARGNEIDCVILDLSMPGMGGEDAFHQMRRLRPDVRVILSSGYDEEDATKQFAGQGLAGFIQKPYTVAKLQEVLNRVLG